MLENFRIKREKEQIKVLEDLYKTTNNPAYLDKIEEHHKKIRKLQSKNMEKLD